MRAQQCRSWTNENAGYLSYEGSTVEEDDDGEEGGGVSAGERTVLGVDI